MNRQRKINNLRRLPALEPLESRQLLSATFGQNLILNPGAEANVGASNSATIVSPRSWFGAGPTVVKYGSPSFLQTSSPGPRLRGKNFFSGGLNASSDLFQTINISSIASFTDGSLASFALSGYFGGNGAQLDTASLSANFQGASLNIISTATVGPVTASDRANQTSLQFESFTGAIPANTRYIQIQLHFSRVAGNVTDGYADNVSLVVSSPMGFITGSVFNDTNNDKKKNGKEKGLANATVYLDFNNNGQFDPFEIQIKTDANGRFSLVEPFGTYIVRQAAPNLYRQSTPAQSFTIKLQKGATNHAALFGDTRVQV